MGKKIECTKKIGQGTKQAGGGFYIIIRELLVLLRVPLILWALLIVGDMIDAQALTFSFWNYLIGSKI